ncbi:adenylate cyclase [Psychromonas sp. CNPT3]|uniref:CYTH domain-containing protein n=1 Tax=Psychromonas sp. CNPT3 TaxID=314282 RepID=UPI00006E5097|nr:CYTH domain-containing protein [Psychromonas sp. CNPT3]AGH82452.1 adenylate cyclase [Psychromonas sp. CNPT3]
MEMEIEIKFLFSTEFEQELVETINQYNFISTNSKILNNVYFDTPDLSLRKMHMGLRVRRSADSIEQTIKLSGKAMGGVHQRPEYNEPLTGTHPVLSAFRDNIWPEGCDVSALEARLIPLFSTDFERRTWLLEMSDNTLIEVAYDKGSISTNTASMALCEIELELIKGNVEQLFVVAQSIATLPQTRLSNVSKAQRGYMLADDLVFESCALSFTPLQPEMSLKTSLLSILQHGLAHIQYHEHCYMGNTDSKALVEVLSGIKFLHQNIKLYQPAFPHLLKANWIDDLHWLARSFSWTESHKVNANLLENKAIYLRKLPKSKLLVKHIQVQNSLFPDPEKCVRILTSSRYAQFILKLTQWLLQFEKQQISSENDATLLQFSSQSLTTIWNEIHVKMAHDQDLPMAHFMDNKGLFESALLTDLSFGCLFNGEDRNNYRELWLDIKQGIDALEMLEVVSDYSEYELNKEMQSEYMKWLQRKQDALLNALQQSQQQALLKEAYWVL